MTKLKNNHNASSSSNNNSTMCLLRKTNLPKGYFKKRKVLQQSKIILMSSTLSHNQLTQSHKHHNHSTSILLPPVTALAKTTLSSTIKTSYNKNILNNDEIRSSSSSLSSLSLSTSQNCCIQSISKKHRRTSHWSNINCALIYALIISHCAVMLSAFETEYTSMQSTIDRALATTVRTPAQMTETDGVCQSMDIRYDPKHLKQLENCRVVEGSVQIFLMDNYAEDEFRNYTFPLLVEVTDYIMFYRINGIRSLAQLFPNLAVIRGQNLFKDYALVIYEMMQLEDIGLSSLTHIERGFVRIEKNDLLCFADKIDWTLIAKSQLTDDNYIHNNKYSEYCPLCPGGHDNPKPECPRFKNDSKKRLCWNLHNCQRKCNCMGDACSALGECCDKNCLGGCNEFDTKNCTVCSKFSMGNGHARKCLDQCPPNTFSHADRRCITEDECYNLNKLRNSTNERTLVPYIPFRGVCHLGCPAEHVEKEQITRTRNKTICERCKGPCLKKCEATIIDSIAAAQKLAGCAIIQGPLEIQIRSQGGRGSNIVKELEQSLSSIVEITDYLKIARSFPIVSLSFLKNLKRIRGDKLESSKHSVVIWDNQNLQELWDEGQTVDIQRGLLFFHYNPKLCYYKIEKLQTPKIVIDNIATAQLSNGDKTACNVTNLNVTVMYVKSHAALLQWNPLLLDDDRGLLGYVVSYIAAPYQNVTIYDGRDACGNDGWHVDDVNDFSPNEAVPYPLTRLEPFTQYAYYVKAYTVATEKTGAQSPIQYFRTLPGKPEAIAKTKALSNSSSEIYVTWEHPKKVNGNLTHYVLKARLIPQDRTILEHRNYCNEPLSDDPTPLPKSESLPAEVKETGDVKDGKCDCNDCTPSKKQPEEVESAIDFEDEIQNFVYIRYSSQQAPPSATQIRNKRDTHQPEVFPENRNNTDIPPKVPDNKNSSRDLEHGFFEYIYAEINSTTTSFVMKDLKHFSSYAISVKACRDGGGDSCGSEAQITERTLKRDDADNILIYEMEIVASNSSLGTIRVTWQSPLKPNGIIVAYTIKYQRVDIDHAKYEYKCISHKIYQNSSGMHLLNNLPTGNYSIQIMATSIAGDGNYTPIKHIFISEHKSYNNLYLLLVLLIALLILIIGIVILCRKMYLPNISSMKLIASVNPDYAGVIYKQDDWEVPREKIIQLHELGQGSFGMVYEGIIKDLKRAGEELRCAIKTVNESATDKERLSFLNEASVMKQFDTHHVVHLLGVVSRGQPTLVIMELMANGDLKGYLRSHRPEYENGDEPPPQPPTLRRILQMAIEIADGMAYLAAKKYVHRDLAARNCMVAEELTVKIGDFGMTRDIYETDYYRKGTKGLLPVRWMSPESLKDGVFTSSSDVFSYGVVLWEMATLASQPYQGLSNDQVLRYVIDGGVMERPENCPDKLYDLMRRCWQHRPSARPSFLEIITMLLEDINPVFKLVSFYHSAEGQDALTQIMQAINIIDDVTTPLRQDEDETSSIDGNHFLMEETHSIQKMGM